MGKDKMTINVSSLSDLRRIYKDAEEKGVKLPIAVAIGVDPALMIAAEIKTPETISEIDVAGALKGSPIRLVTCETNDLLVPADAEIVIEGEVDFSSKVSNNLGEFAGYYGRGVNPEIKITAITHRQDAIYYTILAGPSVEHRTLGTLALINMRKNIIKTIKQKYPFVTGVTLPLIGSMNHIVIAIDKQDDETPAQMIKEIFQIKIGPIPISRMIKRVVIVDNDIDIYDQEDVEWAVWSRVGAADKIIVIPDVQSWDMDYAAKAGKSVRVGIDATKDLEDAEKLRRTIIPGINEINLEDYLQ
jgi:2,5-furandicarboxylate decarboxylase 1